MIATTMALHATGMVFGVFDGFHPGHRYFLTEASKRCDQLIVVVTRSHVVEQLKKRRPKQSDRERIQNIQHHNPLLKVVLGDVVLGSWDVLRMHRPDIVFLGYDQLRIAEELEKMGIRHEFLASYEPERHKSSLYRDQA